MRIKAIPIANVLNLISGMMFSARSPEVSSKRRNWGFPVDRRIIVFNRLGF